MGRRVTLDERRIVEDALSHVPAGTAGRAGCPLCEAVRGRRDVKKSLYLHADGGWVCFRCNATGWLPGTGPRAGADYAMRTVPMPVADPSAEAWRRPPPGFLPLYEDPGDTLPGLDAHRAYLAWRGLDARVLREARVGGVRGGKLGARVVVPVFAPGGAEWWGWSARLIGPPRWEGEFTYRTPEAMPRTRLLYRQEILTVETSAPVFVVEGALKALHLWPHAVATLGKLTADQLRLLTSARRPVVFLADGDAWGPTEPYTAALRAYGLSAGALRTPPKTDPNDYPDGLAVFLPLAFDALRTYGAVDVPAPSELTAGP